VSAPGEPGAAGARPAAVRSPVRALLLGATLAVAGAALIAILAGVFAVDVGLVVVAVVVGRFVGLAVRGGGLATRRRVSLAVTLALASVALGQVATWVYARSEGGVLGLLDYLGQTFGPLVPLELLLAAALAWWSAR
jgi:hypothetical protein